MKQFSDIGTRRQLFRSAVAGVAIVPLLGGKSADALGWRGWDRDHDHGDPDHGGGRRHGGGSTGCCCLLEGTRVSTPTGERPIEDLQIGDEVLTLAGRKAIKWIGYDKYTKDTDRLRHLAIIPRQKGTGRRTSHYRFHLNASDGTHFDEPLNASDGVQKMHPTGCITLDGTPDTRPASAPEPATTDLGAPSGARPGSSRVSVGVAYAPPKKTNSDRPNKSAGPTHNHAAPYENPIKREYISPAPFPVGPSPGADGAALKAKRLAEWFLFQADTGAHGRAAGDTTVKVSPRCTNPECRHTPPYQHWPSPQDGEEIDLWDDMASRLTCTQCGRQSIALDIVPTAPRTGRRDISYRADTQTPPAASPEPQQPQRPPLDGAFTRRWIAERVKWAADAMREPDRGGYRFMGIEVICGCDDGGCGLAMAPEAHWIDWSWLNEQDAKDEYDTLRRLPCPHCGEVGTAVMECRPIPDVVLAPALQPIGAREDTGAQDDAAEDTEDAEVW